MIGEGPYDALRTFVVGNEMKDRDQQDTNGLVEIDKPPDNIIA
jgi:hypothetical protein